MSTVQATKWGVGIAIAFILQAGGFIWWAAQKDAVIVDMEAKVAKLSADAKVVQQVNMERDIKANADSVAQVAQQMESVAATLARLDQKIDTVASQEVEIDMGNYVNQQQFDNYMNNASRDMAAMATREELRDIHNDINAVINNMGDVASERDLAELRDLINRYERSLSGGINEVKRAIEKLNALTFELEERMSEVDDHLGL